VRREFDEGFATSVPDRATQKPKELARTAIAIQVVRPGLPQRRVRNVAQAPWTTDVVACVANGHTPWRFVPRFIYWSVTPTLSLRGQPTSLSRSW